VDPEHVHFSGAVSASLQCDKLVTLIRPDSQRSVQAMSPGEATAVRREDFGVMGTAPVR